MRSRAAIGRPLRFGKMIDDCETDGEALPTRATTAVMLSGPPLRFANSIRIRTASSGPNAEVIAPTSSGATTFERPSEHRG